MKENRKSGFPQHFIFFDTETYENPIDEETIEHRLRLGCLCYVRLPCKNRALYEEWYFFYSPTQFFDYLEGRLHKKERLWIMAHNLHFDFFAVNAIEEITKRGYEIKDNPPNIVKTNNGG